MLDVAHQYSASYLLCNVSHACIPQMCTICQVHCTNVTTIHIYTHTYTQGHFRHASVLERMGRWREAVVRYLLCLHLGGNDQTVVKAVCKVMVCEDEGVRGVTMCQNMDGT